MIPSDAEGIDPDALDAACPANAIRAIYVVPTNDDPTSATMGVARRQALAETAERHGLILIENDAHGFMLESAVPPIASFAPDRTWHSARASKILSPGLRVAWLRAPTVTQPWRLTADPHETAVMAPPLNAAIIAEWIESGAFRQLARPLRKSPHRTPAQAGAQGHERKPLFCLALDPRLRGDTVRIRRE